MISASEKWRNTKRLCYTVLTKQCRSCDYFCRSDPGIQPSGHCYFTMIREIIVINVNCAM